MTQSDLKADSLNAIEHELRLLDRGDGVTLIEPLSGGAIADVWLVTYSDGTRIVAKTIHDAPEDTFPLEAEGLAALRATGTVEVPEVHAANGRLLLLALLPPRNDRETAWEAFAHDLAALHQSTVDERFGWHHDNYRGKLRQCNTWTDDGHAFVAEHRLLRYLDEPGAQQVLETADRRALERLCDRLTEIIPAMPPVLTHGDLGAYNVLGGSNGALALVDPAVSYIWAEFDLALLYWSKDNLPAVNHFFGVYHELNPSPDGWEERMPLLALLEVLSWVAHIGLVPLPDPGPIVELLRNTLAPYYDN